MSAPNSDPTGSLHTGFLHTAIRAAQAAARIHQRNVGRDLEIDTKSTEIDLVTRVDKESEAAIREILLSAYPDHVVLGEEAGQEGDAPYRWIVDPLDGTLNYAHGFPFYCVSIALEIRGRIEVGVVLDSVHDELFSATRGGGAFLNGAPIRVTQETDLRRSMLATGFAYTTEIMMENVELFRRMLPRCRAIRRPGAAALDLAYVACGRLDGFWELALNPWDCAAGLLLIEEAGGRVSSGSGDPYKLTDRVMVVSNGPLHESLLAALELPEAVN
jgi:myo-inositol-1(or 4)-monophosphatase